MSGAAHGMSGAAGRSGSASASRSAHGAVHQPGEGLEIHDHQPGCCRMRGGDAAQHLDREEAAQFLREARRVLQPGGITLSPSAPADHPDLELPAEAFVRLVYGRLDQDHTPPFTGAEADLDELRRAFPGV